MGLAHSPRIVTNGLVFAYDMENTKKSWKGKPTTNLVPYDFTAWTRNANGLTVTETGTFEGTPVYALIETATTDYHRRGYSIASSAGSTRRCSFIARSYGSPYARSWSWTGGTTGASFFDLINGTSSGSNSPTIQHLYDGWYYCTFQVDSVNNDTVVIATSPNNSIGTGTFTGTVGIGILATKPQLEVGTFATPYVDGTRSNTQAILDLTGNNTVTASSLTYNSDVTFSFNGSSDYINAPLDLGSSDPIVTINQWIRRTANFTNGGYWGLGGGSSNNGINGYTSVTNKIGWDLWGQTTFHTGQDYPLNQWVNVCWVKTAPTFTTSTLKVYINGIEFPLTSTVRNNSSSLSLASGFAIGRLTQSVSAYHAPGQVASTDVYNRALTPSEVQQNFNAIRGRYGI